MIITLTSFELNSDFSPQKAHQAFADSAPKFLKKPGLIRKFFILSDDGLRGGGIYLWENRAAADAFLTEAWKQFIADKYGSRPTVTYYDCLVEVDNVTGVITS